MQHIAALAWSVCGMRRQSRQNRLVGHDHYKCRNVDIQHGRVGDHQAAHCHTLLVNIISFIQVVARCSCGYFLDCSMSTAGFTWCSSGDCLGRSLWPCRMAQLWWICSICRVCSRLLQWPVAWLALIFSAWQHICYSALCAIARPSLHPSVTRVNQSKTVEVRIMQPSPRVDPWL